jgi:hypothetical protein
MISPVTGEIPMHSSLILGIDPAKEKFTAAFFAAADPKPQPGRDFPMSRQGFDELAQTIAGRLAGGQRLVVGVEATAALDDNLPAWLAAQRRRWPLTLLRLDPAQVARFSGARPVRGKTDKADARRIARQAARFAGCAGAPPPQGDQAPSRRSAAAAQKRRDAQLIRRLVAPTRPLFRDQDPGDFNVVIERNSTQTPILSSERRARADSADTQPSPKGAEQSNVADRPSRPDARLLPIRVPTIKLDQSEMLVVEIVVVDRHEVPEIARLFRADDVDQLQPPRRLVAMHPEQRKTTRRAQQHDRRDAQHDDPSHGCPLPSVEAFDPSRTAANHNPRSPPFATDF